MCLPSAGKTIMATFWILAIVATSPLYVSAETGNLYDCLTGCKAGDNACASCCQDKFKAMDSTHCYESFIECNQMCEGQVGVKGVMCFKDCQKSLKACMGDDVQDSEEFDCPCWREPEECPEECQTWSPQSQKCVPAPKNLCDELQ